MKLIWLVKEQGVAGEFGKPSAAVTGGERQKFISCRGDESGREMAGWRNPVPPTPKNSPRGLRLVYTSPKRGIFYHIKKYRRRLMSLSLAARCPSLYLPCVSVYCLTTAHTPQTRQEQRKVKVENTIMFVLDQFLFQVYSLLPLPSFQ